MVKELTVQDLFNEYYITDTGFAAQVEAGDIVIKGEGGGLSAEDIKGVKFAYSTFSQLPDAIANADWSSKEGMEYCFAFCSSLTSISLPDLPNVTNMSSCFPGCTSLTSIVLPELPNVKGMHTCFSGCSSLTSISLPELPNATSMNYCFMNCKSLTCITLPSLPEVTGIVCCFYNCSSLTSISLPELPKVTNMGSCFHYCTSLKSITLPELPNVTCMSNCFDSCSSLQDLTIGNIGRSIGTGPQNPLSVSYCPLLTHDSLMNLINALPFKWGQYLSLGTTNLSKLTDDEKAMVTNNGWTLLSY